MYIWHRKYHKFNLSQGELILQKVSIEQDKRNANQKQSLTSN